MADASPSLWQTLVTVGVGGLLALAGGWFGPSLLERRREAASKKNKRADKFEELVAALYQFDQWLDDLRDHETSGRERTSPIAVSPLAKVRAISAVYFPRFDGQISELETAAGGYRVWMLAAGQRRLSGDSLGMRDGMNQAYLPYVKKRDALLGALKDFAHTEFQ